MNWLFGSPAAVIECNLTNTEGRTKRKVDFGDDEVVECYVYGDDDHVKAKAVVTSPASSPVDHEGITAELRGVVELYPDRGNPRTVVHETRELEPAGKFAGSKSFDLDFAPRFKLDSYSGVNVRVRYFIVVTMLRSGMSSHISKTVELLVENTSVRPESPPRIRMEVGIEGFLHIEFEYNKNAYHLEDVVTGAVLFRQVKLPIKHAEVAILRRENCNAAGMVYSESDTVGKFEVMDGAPVGGETIPIRLFLDPYHLGTSAELDGVFQVRYFLSLILVDEDERRYFKQHQIQLWRKKPEDTDPPMPKASLRSLAHDVENTLGQHDEEKKEDEEPQEN